MEGEPSVVCTDLVVRYGSRTAVDGVSLVAERGEVLCVLGPNGAGKTSTIECLEGYRRPAGGTARVLGLDPWTQHRALVSRIGVMLQRGGVYPMLGPIRALRLFASYYEEPEDPDALLDLVRLGDVSQTPWRHLSGGEQARLSLALALVGRPEVVFLDEPTAGVDPEGRLAVRDVVVGLRARGACVVLTTHEMPEAEQLADRVLILDRGVVAAHGSVAGLRAGGESSISFGAPPGLDVAALGAAVGAPVAEGPAGRYQVGWIGDTGVEVGGTAAEVGGTAADAPALAAGVTAWLAARGLALSDLRVGRSLEETYLSVVGARGPADSGSGGGEGEIRRRRRRVAR